MLKDGWYREDWYKSGMGISFKIKGQLFSEKSTFQKIDVFDTKAVGKLAVFDDCVMLTTRFNHFYHEMLAHPALTPRSEPTSVLIIGGGDCGVLHEVLKHRHVAQVQQVEIDALVTKMSEKYFPELCVSNHDRRAWLHFEDGIEWMKRTPSSTYDVIIVDSTDPVGMAAGLFSDDYYQHCLRALRSYGTFVTQTSSPILHKEHVVDVRNRLRKVGFRDTATLTFPQPDYPSGTWSVTLASKGGEIKKVLPDVKIPEATYYSRSVHEGGLCFPSFQFN